MISSRDNSSDVVVGTLVCETECSCYASGPKHAQTLQIQKVYPVAHSSASNFCHYSSIFLTLGWIPMIQVSFNSSCVAIQYETGTKFSIKRFLSYTLLRTVQIRTM